MKVTEVDVNGEAHIAIAVKQQQPTLRGSKQVVVDEQAVSDVKDPVTGRRLVVRVIAWLTSEI